MAFDLAAALVPVLANLLLKAWAGDAAAAVGGKLTERVFGWLKDQRARAKAENRASEIAGEIVAGLEPLFAHELRGANPDAVLADLGDLVARQELVTLLAESNLAAERILGRMIELQPPSSGSSTDPDRALYLKAVARLADALSKIAPELPGFTRAATAVDLARGEAALQGLDALARRVETLLGASDAKLDALLAAALAQQDRQRTLEERVDDLRRAPHRIAEGFTLTYLDRLRLALDEVPIFGLDLDRSAQRPKLSIAYVSLATRLGVGGEPRSVNAATLLAHLPRLGNRLLIEGPAGSGKTTLTRWMAIQAAKAGLGEPVDRAVSGFPDHDEGSAAARRREALAALSGAEAADFDPPSLAGDPLGSGWPPPAGPGPAEVPFWARVPVIVPLRLVVDGTGEAEMPVLVLNPRPTPPPEWHRALFADRGDRLLLVFDGIDEVPVGPKRDQWIAAIEHYAAAWPAAQLVVTSRPRAVDARALRGFTRVTLEELSEPQRRDFVTFWHRALAHGLGKPDGDAVLLRLRDAVLLEIERRRALADLAANPLLCAGFCALHWYDRRHEVEQAWNDPGRFRAFTDEGHILPNNLWRLCERLTEMLVHKRDVQQGVGAFGPEYALAYEQRRDVLARMAWHMIANEVVSSLPRAEAAAQIGTELARARSAEPLAPARVLDALLARSGILRESGEDEIEFSHNTIKAFLAAKYYLALGAPKDLARRLWDAEPKELDAGLDEVAVLAAASPDHSDYARQLIEALLTGRFWHRGATRRQHRILALRCEAAAPNLPEDVREKVRAQAATLFPPRNVEEARRLAPLGDEALPYLDVGKTLEAGSRPPGAIAAIARCLRLIGTPRAKEALGRLLETDLMSVAEELSAVFHPLSIPLVRRHVLEAREPLPDPIRVAIRDLEPLRTEAAATRVSLRNVPVNDLTPLAGFTNLSSLDLSGTSVSDLAPLAGLTNLSSLDLSGTSVSDLAPLAGLTNLSSLDLRGTSVSDLAPLAGLSKLSFLDLSGTSVSDLASLTGLTNLSSLDLGSTSVSDLTPLTGLSNLSILILLGTSVSDISPLAGLTKLSFLDLDNTSVDDLNPLAGLSKLSHLYLSSTPVRNLTSLYGLSNLKTIWLMNSRATVDQVTELRKRLSPPAGTLRQIRQ